MKHEVFSLQYYDNELQASKLSAASFQLPKASAWNFTELWLSQHPQVF